MNQEIKVKWIAALRSGEYKQGHGQLQIGETFCCLGVLCDIAKKDGVEVSRNSDGRLLGHMLNNHLWVMKWAGIDDECPSVMGEELIVWNDGKEKLVKRHSFNEIADMIEKSGL